MPKVNVYLPDGLASAVRDAQLPVSAICQRALEEAVRDVASARGSEAPPRQGQRGVGLFRRFTPRARQAVALAEQRARGTVRGVGTEHILLGVLDEGANLAVTVLESMDVEPEDLRSELMGSMPAAEEVVAEHLPFTPLAKQAVESAAKESRGLGHNYIGCEHLLLGLVATEAGLASQVLRRMGLELRTARQAVTTALSGFAQPLGRRMPRLFGALEEILRRLDAIEQRLPSS
jgi:ATP-dependent Clp protease ATP-binding subunit ClpC